MSPLSTVMRREEAIRERGLSRSVRVNDGEDGTTVITDFTEHWLVCCKDRTRPVEPELLTPVE